MADSDTEVAIVQDEQVVEQEDPKDEEGEQSHSRETTPETGENEEADLTTRVEQLVVEQEETQQSREEPEEALGGEEKEEIAEEEAVGGASVDAQEPQQITPCLAADVHSSPEPHELASERDETVATAFGMVTPPSEQQETPSPSQTSSSGSGGAKKKRTRKKVYH